MVAAAALLLTGCEHPSTVQQDQVDIPVDTHAATRFATSSRMYELAKAGTVKIGVKFDQPGLGYKPPGQKTPVGFDIEIGKLLAAKLGIAPDKVRWVPIDSEQREPFLQKHTVDFVVASYSLSDDRRRVVGQAGPYFITGQQLLVERGSAIKSVADTAGRTVCAVAGSTALVRMKQQHRAKVQAAGTTRQCRDRVLKGTADAMTGDGGTLLGYAAQDPDSLAVVGKPLTRERYGVGYAKDRPELCQFISDTILGAEQQHLWAEAFKATLGKARVDTPKPPELDECP
ncbi:MAG TPA: glutamate ABC transporter substrate-binding protein [Aeromicrobium sp.]|nr:glutamate ABC transporter substrate-binding protein [Aeromicrobium sp.]